MCSWSAYMTSGVISVFFSDVTCICDVIFHSDSGQVDESRKNIDCTTAQQNTRNVYVLPVTDIVEVDLCRIRDTMSKELCRSLTSCLGIENYRTMSITTLTYGYFDFAFDTKNGHNVMVVFL